jgi:hypothetical protein
MLHIINSNNSGGSGDGGNSTSRRKTVVLSFCFGEGVLILYVNNRLCGLVVRVSGYRSRGPTFDSWLYQIF